MLAHVITVREINPFARHGIMKLDDMKVLLKGSTNLRSYLLHLLQKFELALTWDGRSLLLPSLLPDEYQLRAGYPDCEVKVPIQARGWLWRLKQQLQYQNSNISRSPSVDQKGPQGPLLTLSKPGSLFCFTVMYDGYWDSYDIEKTIAKCSSKKAMCVAFVCGQNSSRLLGYIFDRIFFQK